MKTVLNIKTDREVKQKAQQIARDLGLPLSTVINAYLKEFVREREVRFSLEPQLRPEVGKLLEKASEDFKKHRSVSPAFAGAKEAIKYLRSR